ncbi:hypothetical protein GCM10010254_53170 [Streptomyces chromofuscus]|nr:hypothetical protein GCM10010254_53170 [Streptomyces chromofuscus]
MDGTSISFVDVTRFSRTAAALRDEPNRLRAIGQPVAHLMDGTESKLFPNGTKTGSQVGGTKR